MKQLALITLVLAIFCSALSILLLGCGQAA